MSQPAVVAKTLEVLEQNLVSPGLIDAAEANGLVGYNDLVLTSMGNLTRAIITPYYPHIQSNNSIFDRLHSAHIGSRPLVEAGIRVVTNESGGVDTATVVMRLHEGDLGYGPILVHETAAAYDLGGLVCGTMHRVIDMVVHNRHLGVTVKGRNGVVVFDPEKRGAKGKWAISKVDRPYVVADRINNWVLGAHFKTIFN